MWAEAELWTTPCYATVTILRLGTVLCHLESPFAYNLIPYLQQTTEICSYYLILQREHWDQRGKTDWPRLSQTLFFFSLLFQFCFPRKAGTVWEACLGTRKATDGWGLGGCLSMECEVPSHLGWCHYLPSVTQRYGNMNWKSRQRRMPDSIADSGDRAGNETHGLFVLRELPFLQTVSC